MTLRRKVVYGFLGVLMIVFAIALFLLSHSMIPSDNKLVDGHSYPDAFTVVKTVAVDSHQVRVLEVSQQDASERPKLYMIHGAPGGITAYSKYFNDSTLRSVFDLISYDRPGYSPDDMTPLSSISDQAYVLTGVIEATSNMSDKVLLLSHSYGGPIACLVTSALGKQVLGHVMVAPVIDPDSEPLFWYSALPMKTPFKQIVSPELYTASVEKMAHASSLRKIESRWAEVASPLVHFHGEEDWLAPAANMNYVSRHFDEAILIQQMYPDRSHFILWSDDTFCEIRDRLMNLEAKTGINSMKEARN